MTGSALASPCLYAVAQGNAVVFNNPGGIAFVQYGGNSLKLAPTLAALETDAQLALLIGDLAYAM